MITLSSVQQNPIINIISRFPVIITIISQRHNKSVGHDAMLPPSSGQFLPHQPTLRPQDSSYPTNQPSSSGQFLPHQPTFVLRTVPSVHQPPQRLNNDVVHDTVFPPSSGQFLPHQLTLRPQDSSYPTNHHCVTVNTTTMFTLITIRRNRNPENMVSRQQIRLKLLLT
jgi:hypothetical protein